MTDREPAHDPTRDVSLIEDLVAQCVEAMEHEGDAALERICADHAELARAVRARVGQLRDMGLVRSRETHPEFIGALRILEVLGSGGMGTVYRAEQREPVHRDVAVKLIKAGMDTAEIVRRFEAEQQALALMSHPCIAKVFEAGATASGRPYFVMEYAPGEPVTTYCDARRLGTEARLDLFVKVCEAVQHAHQKGVLHRDLKPGNILVTELDGKPLPKVIDFGIAKTTGEHLTDAGLTLTGQVIGTLEYMSPEQAGTAGHDVDTRSDVYSLGVVLYELLGGRRPLELGTERDLLRRLRTLREEVPRAPSTGISEPIARARGTDTASLRRRLLGDLDWIVLRALEKDRDRRYPSALALGEDIRRHLEHEPVHAGPPSSLYRARKFVRRHRYGVAAAAVSLLALVAALVVSNVYRGQAVDSARAESAALDEALQSFDLARDAVFRMLVQVGGERLDHVPRATGLRRELLEEALRYYEKLLARRGSHRRLREDAIRAIITAADIYRALRQTGKAVAVLEDGLEQVRGLIEADPRDVSARTAQATMQASYGDSLARLGRRKDAVAALDKALEMFAGRNALAARSGIAADRGPEATAHISLSVLLRTSDAARGRDAAVAAIRIAEALPPGADRDRLMALGFRQLAVMHENLGEPDRAREVYDRALADLRASSGQDPKAWRRELLVTLEGDLAGLLKDHGRAQQAADLFEKVVETLSDLATGNPERIDLQFNLARAHSRLAGAYGDLRKRDAMLEHLRTALAKEEDLVARYPDELDIAKSLAGSCTDLATELLRRVVDLGDPPSNGERAAALLTRAFELLEQFPPDQRDDDEVTRLASASHRLGQIPHLLGTADARRHADRACRLFGEILDRHPEDAGRRMNLAKALQMAGLNYDSGADPDRPRARSLVRAALDHAVSARKVLGRPKDDEEVFRIRWVLADIEVGCGDHAAAARLVGEAAEEAGGDLPVGAALRFGDVLLSCARLAEGQPTGAGYVRQARNIFLRSKRTLDGAAEDWRASRSDPDLARIPGGFLHVYGAVHNRLGRLLRSAGRGPQGRESLTRAVDLFRRSITAGREERQPVSVLHPVFSDLMEAELEDARPGAARALATELVELLPEDGHALYLAARVLARTGDDAAEQAIELLTGSAARGYRPATRPELDRAFAALHGNGAFQAAAARFR